MSRPPSPQVDEARERMRLNLEGARLCLEAAENSTGFVSALHLASARQHMAAVIASALDRSR